MARYTNSFHNVPPRLLIPSMLKCCDWMNSFKTFRLVFCLPSKFGIRKRLEKTSLWVHHCRYSCILETSSVISWLYIVVVVTCSPDRVRTQILNDSLELHSAPTNLLIIRTSQLSRKWAMLSSSFCWHWDHAHAGNSYDSKVLKYIWLFLVNEIWLPI